VQLLVALGSRLKTEGYEVLIIVSVNNVKFVESFGLKAAPCFPDIEAFIRENKRIRGDIVQRVLDEEKTWESHLNY